MGNSLSTSQNEIPDNLERIGSDVIEKCQRTRFNSELIGEDDQVYPRSLFGFLNWWSSIPIRTFCFDPLKLDKSIKHGKSLTNQIKIIVEDMAVTEEEAERIVLMIKDDLVKALDPERHNPYRRLRSDISDVDLYICDAMRRLQCFGSYRNGLCSNDSDVDLYFCLDNIRVDDDCGYLPAIDQKTIYTQVSLLLRASREFTNVFYKQARVPILTMDHLASGKKVDILVSTDPTSITNTELMKFYVLSNGNVKYLTLFLKKELIRHGLHGTNRITTTILFWLVVFFMQKMDSLPSVFDARKLPRTIEHYDGWDHSVPGVKRTNSSTDSEDLFTLLLNFLKFYKEFGFSQYVICPLIGREIPIHSFKNLDFKHEAFNVYVEKLRKHEISTGFPIRCINLQDPTIHCKNLVTQNTEIENILNRFKILCDRLLQNFAAEDGYRRQVLEDYIPSYLRLENSWYLLTQCYTLSLSFHQNSQGSLMNARRFILNAIRAVMVDIFSFNCDYIVPMNGDRRQNDKGVSYTYFQLSASAETRQNPFICRVFKLSDIPRDINLAELPISIHIVCEINVKEKSTKIMVESDQYLHTFFESNLRKILTAVLKKRDITVQTNIPYCSTYGA